MDFILSKIGNGNENSESSDNLEDHETIMAQHDERILEKFFIMPAEGLRSIG